MRVIASLLSLIYQLEADTKCFIIPNKTISKSVDLYTTLGKIITQTYSDELSGSCLRQRDKNPHLKFSISLFKNWLLSSYFFYKKFVREVLLPNSIYYTQIQLSSFMSKYREDF